MSACLSWAAERMRAERVLETIPPDPRHDDDFLKWATLAAGPEAAADALYHRLKERNYREASR